MKNRYNAVYRYLITAVLFASTMTIDNLAHAELTPSGSLVTDSGSGIVWNRCSQGQIWNGTTCTGTALNYTHQQALLLAAPASVGWRLPNIKELDSIVDRTRTDPAINITAFPNTASSCYWSSTPYTNPTPSTSSVYVWYADFGSGQTGYGYHQNNDHSCKVRLVKHPKKLTGLAGTEVVSTGAVTGLPGTPVSNTTNPGTVDINVRE